MKHKIIFIFLIILITVIQTGCSRNLSSGFYTSSKVGEVINTFKGKIIQARVVNIRDADQISKNTVGVITGSFLGSAAGSQIIEEEGTGSNVMTALGAFLGAIAGAFLQEKLTEQKGIEYTISLTDGRTLTIVQGIDTNFNIGQSVNVQINLHGRSRVILFN